MAGIPIIVYPIIGLVTAIGAMALWYKNKLKNKKTAIPIVLIIPETGRIKLNYVEGYRLYVLTQVRLHIPALNRQFDFPAPSRFINGVVYYIQVDSVTWLPVNLKQFEYLSKDIKEIINKTTYNEVLSQPELQKLVTYIETENMERVINPAFSSIYEKNIEKIVKATTIYVKTWADVLKDLMPYIAIVIGVIAMAIFWQSAAGGNLAALSHEIAQGLQINCPPINITTGIATVPSAPAGITPPAI